MRFDVCEIGKEARVSEGVLLFEGEEGEGGGWGGG